MKRTFQVSDIDGSNKRNMTLEQVRAEIDTAKTAAMKKFQDDADRAGLSVNPRWRA